MFTGGGFVIVTVKVVEGGGTGMFENGLGTKPVIDNLLWRGGKYIRTRTWRSFGHERDIHIYIYIYIYKHFRGNWKEFPSSLDYNPQKYTGG